MSDEHSRTDERPSTTKTFPSAGADGDANRAILAALRQNDRIAAAGLLVETHAGAIGQACMALLGSQSEAEGALRDTLLAALDGLETFRGEGTLRSWLLSIARRRCARRLAERTSDGEAKHGLDAAAAAAAPATGERPSTARHARRLLDELKPTEREALVLRFAAELSFREIGVACGIDEVGAQKRVSRGLSRLRALPDEDAS